MIACRCPRIPPRSEPLTFVRRAAKRVHVAQWHDPACDAPDPVFADADEATRIVAALHGPVFYGLCGVRIRADGYAAFTTVDFPDGDLCGACVKLMGEDAWRAFHHRT